MADTPQSVGQGKSVTVMTVAFRVSVPHNGDHPLSLTDHMEFIASKVEEMLTTIPSFTVARLTPMVVSLGSQEGQMQELVTTWREVTDGA